MVEGIDIGRIERPDASLPTYLDLSLVDIVRLVLLLVASLEELLAI